LCPDEEIATADGVDSVAHPDGDGAEPGSLDA